MGMEGGIMFTEDKSVWEGARCFPVYILQDLHLRVMIINR